MTTRTALITDLTWLQENITRTLKRINDDEAADEHLLVNSAHITARLGVWNLLVDVIPLVEEESKP